MKGYAAPRSHPRAPGWKIAKYIQDVMTNGALDMLKDSMKLASAIHKQYDERFAQTGAKIGETMAIRIPARFK